MQPSRDPEGRTHPWEAIGALFCLLDQVSTSHAWHAKSPCTYALSPPLHFAPPHACPCRPCRTTPATNSVLMPLVEALFGFKPFFAFAAKNARGMIVKRAESIGLDWDSAMRDMKV
jgi:hypothetical protein